MVNFCNPLTLPHYHAKILIVSSETQKTEAKLMIITNSRFLFVRHANTEKGPIDKDRRITDKGRDQALALKQRLGDVSFDLAITSTAKRTHETALLLINKANESTRVVGLDILYRLPDDEGEKICSEMFRELGYAPLKDYLAHFGAKTLHRLGEEATIAIYNTIGKSPSGKDFLIVSHAVLLNVIILHMFPSEKVSELALEANLGECGTIEVVVGESDQDIVVRAIN